jgi:hypothetical protein
MMASAASVVYEGRAERRLRALPALPKQPIREVAVAGKPLADKIPPDQLRDAMTYDPATGEFRWIAPFGKLNHRFIGQRAGCVRPDGYLQIGVAGRRYEAARLAWWFVHGEMPSVIVDHRDRNPLNNAIDNLRLSDAPKNAANSRLRSQRKYSQYRGVTWYAGKWVAQARVNGKAKKLGRFTDEEDAARAYDAAALEAYGDHANLNFGAAK